MISIDLSATATHQDLLRIHTLLIESDDPYAELRIADTTNWQSSLAYGRLMQAILTWGLSKERSSLLLPGTRPIAGWINAMRQSDHLLVAALLANTVTDSSGSDLTQEVYRASRDVVRTRNVMGFDPAASAPGRRSIVLPTFIPSTSTSKDLHALADGRWGIQEEARSLYHDIWAPSAAPEVLRAPLESQRERLLSDDRGVRVSRTRWPRDYSEPAPADPFKPLAARAFRATGEPDNLLNRHRSSKLMSDDIGEVLFELIQNSEWHTLNAPGGTTGRNIRIVSFATLEVDSDAISTLGANDEHLTRYLRRLVAGASAANNRALVGFGSVIDTGIGLAASAARRTGQEGELNLDNEMNFLKAAMDKTTKVVPRTMASYGLPRVQWLLTELDGYMSFRTGNLQIGRDFVEKPFAGGLQNLYPGRLSETERFIDWVTGDPNYARQGPRVGTDVTFAIPLSETDSEQ